MFQLSILKGPGWKYFILALALLGSACTSLRPEFEQPTVTVNSFRILKTESFAPHFEIGLHIVNPNRDELRLRGISYTVHLEGHKVLTGVANDLPVIEAYGEVDVLVSAWVDLFNSVQLILDLIRDRNESFSYQLDAKLDPGGFQPSIRIRKQGEIQLSGRQGQVLEI
jgi:LEA14-like dessication related protein